MIQRGPFFFLSRTNEWFDKKCHYSWKQTQIWEGNLWYSCDSAMQCRCIHEGGNLYSTIASEEIFESGGRDRSVSALTEGFSDRSLAISQSQVGICMGTANPHGSWVWVSVGMGQGMAMMYPYPYPYPLVGLVVVPMGMLYTCWYTIYVQYIQYLIHSYYIVLCTLYWINTIVSQY